MARAQIQQHNLRVLVVILGGLAVAGCLSTGSPPPPPPAPEIKLACLPMPSYSSSEQKQLLAEFIHLDKNSILHRVIMDYEAMRDANRACQGASSQ